MSCKSRWKRCLLGVKEARIGDDVWICDLRRSFCTLARKRGLAESEVMKSSGHATTAVYSRHNGADEDDAREVARVVEQGRNLGQEMVNAG